MRDQAAPRLPLGGDDASFKDVHPTIGLCLNALDQASTRAYEAEAKLHGMICRAEGEREVPEGGNQAPTDRVHIKQLRELSDFVAWEFKKLCRIAWAADQLLMQNTDNTISTGQLVDRISTLLEVIQDKAKALSEMLESSN